MTSRAHEDHPGQGVDTSVGYVVVGLSVVTDSGDAFSFLRLGHVFASVMTGNLVLLGVSGGRLDGTAAAHALTTFGGYVAGVAVGTRLARRRPHLRRSFVEGLFIELAIMTGVAVGWEVTGAQPGEAVQLVLLALLSAMLGLQSALVRSLTRHRSSATYFTGTLTDVIADLAQWRRAGGEGRQIGSLAGLVAGAGAPTVLAVEAAGSAPFVALGVLVIVVGRMATTRRA